ncbi:hypothetical protein [Plasmodium yoelii yoelii]|uniref:Lon proteolytic domain-containing protein n=1 Tax=Plasmodium yoelii yoelii TaxID=73239 RepID=Q7RAU3_PLAYO|nr:hypothetical protein [Plasmodium yoelii yoelii]
MTGELTLNGNILRIGGLVEKIITAKNSGIQTLIIPKDNYHEYLLIPKEIKDNLHILYAHHYYQIFNYIFAPKIYGKEIKRVVGLILIRGDNIVSFTAERAPINKKTTNNITNKGIATGRGISLNNYVPMQNNMTPNMPTGVGINVATSKNLTPIVNPGFKSPNIPTNNKMPFMPMPMQINQNLGTSNNSQRGLSNQISTQLPFPPNSKPPTEQ